MAALGFLVWTAPAGVPTTAAAGPAFLSVEGVSPGGGAPIAVHWVKPVMPPRPCSSPPGFEGFTTCVTCDPWVPWSTLDGQTTPYTIPPPKNPNPNAMLPRRWPQAPGGGTRVAYEVNLNPGHLPTLAPAPPPSPCTSWPNASDPLGVRIDAWLYWVSACAQSWNENPTSDIDLRLVQPPSLLPDDFPYYDSTPGDGTADAAFGANQIWDPLNGGPTGNGRNEVIAVDTISGGPVGGGTSMLYDAATGDIIEVDIIVTKTVANNLVTQNWAAGGAQASLLTHELGHMLGLDHSDLTRRFLSNPPPWATGPSSTDPSRTLPVAGGQPPVASGGSNPGFMADYRGLPPLQIPLWPDDAAGVSNLYPIHGQLWDAPVTRANCADPAHPIVATMHKTSLINVTGRIEGFVERTSDGARLWGGHVVAIDAAGFDTSLEQGPAVAGKLSGYDRLSQDSVIGAFDEDSLKMTSGEYVIDGLPAQNLPVPGPGWVFSSVPRDYHLVVEPLCWTLGHNPSGVHFAEHIADPNLNPGVSPNLAYPAGFSLALNLLLDDYWSPSGNPDYVFNPVFLLSTAPSFQGACASQQSPPFLAFRIHPGSVIRVDLYADPSSYGAGQPGQYPPNANGLLISYPKDRPNIALVEASGSRIPASQSGYGVPASFIVTVQSNVDLGACGYMLKGLCTWGSGSKGHMTFSPAPFPSYPPSGTYTFVAYPPSSPGITVPLEVRIKLTNGSVTVENRLVW